jgi:hypothetical protein
MSDGRPEYCMICGAPVVWCTCTQAQPQSGDIAKPIGIWDGDPIEHVLRSRIQAFEAEVAKRDANIVFLEDQLAQARQRIVELEAAGDEMDRLRWRSNNLIAVIDAAHKWAKLRSLRSSPAAGQSQDGDKEQDNG